MSQRMCHLDTAQCRILRDSGKSLIKMPREIGLTSDWFGKLLRNYRTIQSLVFVQWTSFSRKKFALVHTQRKESIAHTGLLSNFTFPLFSTLTILTKQFWHFKVASKIPHKGINFKAGGEILTPTVLVVNSISTQHISLSRPLGLEVSNLTVTWPVGSCHLCPDLLCTLPWSRENISFMILMENTPPGQPLSFFLEERIHVASCLGNVCTCM